MSALPAEIEMGGVPVITGNSRHAPSGGAGPVSRSVLAEPVLPCPSCSHRAVCAIRPKLEAAELAMRSPMSPDPAITIRLAVTVECSHFLADGTAEPPNTAERARLGGRSASTPARRGSEFGKPKVTGAAAAEMTAASRRRGAERHAEVMRTKPKEVVVPAASDRDLRIVQLAAEGRALTAIAIELGISYERVRQIVKAAKAAGRYPAVVVDEGDESP